MPGLRSAILYTPWASVTALRTFSINAGLDASTVTPGSTPPDTSLTVPAIVACAYAVVETNTDTITPAATFSTLRIRTSVRKLSGKPQSTRSVPRHTEGRLRGVTRRTADILHAHSGFHFIGTLSSGTRGCQGQFYGSN